MVVNVPLFSQVDTLECIQDILDYEEALYGGIGNDKTVYLNYKTTAVDWERNVSSSLVKIYKNNENVHFFSKEGKLFKDAAEMFLVLPNQKLIVANSVSDELKETGYDNNFLELRKKFMLSSELIFCRVTDSVKGIKEVKLRVNEDLEGLIDIEEMIYTINTKLKKVLKTNVLYSESYKIKEMTIDYLDFNGNANYKFKRASRYILANNNKLTSKYSTYELIDNREN